MMICKGCYKETPKDFCPKCRKKLGFGTKISARLTFGAPNANNLLEFQRNTTRLSISGVQLKYSLRIIERELALTEIGGEYILKPIPPSSQILTVEEAPENEHLTMQIASQIFNIKTASNALVYFNDGLPAYLTRRFDVKQDGNKYLQEDFAQLLSRTSRTHGENYKYDGTYEEIGEFIRKYVAAAPPAIEELFRLITFNYVIGNGDAHLKNFSLIQTETGEYQLTPAYDLMNTKLHMPYESDTALELYENCMDVEFYGDNGFYGRPDFMAFAKRLGIVEKRVIAILDTYGKQRDAVIEMIKKSNLSAGSKEKYSNIFEDRLSRIK